MPNMFYTGNEKSPLHYGLSAEGYDINIAMEGHDKNIWVVDVKNNKKVWIRKDSIIKIEKEEPVIKDDTNDKDIKEKNNPTDYNIYIKYRLNILKNESKDNTNKTNFDLVRAEWQDLKKDPKKMKENMVEAKKWFEKSKDVVISKKGRAKSIKN